MPYRIDPYALMQHRDPLIVVETLVDRMERPGWSRESLCRRCEAWSPSQGEAARPRRPGADALESCAGCWFGHLDLVEATAEPGQLADELAMLEAGSIDRAPGRRKRELRARAEYLRQLRRVRQAQLELEPPPAWRPRARYTEFAFVDGRHQAVIPPLPPESESA